MLICGKLPLRSDFMRAAIRLMVINSKKFMGPGTRVLLEKIHELSSIKAASKAMEMSYTKALRILRDMETELGFSVVVSEKGGYNRGGTKLTEKGEKVMNAFKEIEQDVTLYAQKLVDDKFKF